MNSLDTLDILEFDKDFAEIRENFRKEFGDTDLFDEFCLGLIKKLTNGITKDVYGLEPRKERIGND